MVTINFGKKFPKILMIPYPKRGCFMTNKLNPWLHSSGQEGKQKWKGDSKQTRKKKKKRKKKGKEVKKKEKK